MKNYGKNLFVLLLITNVAFIYSQEDDEATVEIDPDDPSIKNSVDIPYESPTIADKSKVYFAEHFDNHEYFEKKWVRSEAKKEGISEDIAKYDGEWSIEKPQRDGLHGDKGLVLKTQAKHAAISANLEKPFVFKDKSLIVQYEVTLQDGQTCGGSYLKLISKAAQPLNLKQFQDKTPYSIMFGPDKCGNDYKLHFIFNHRNPLNGSVEEKHCKKPKDRLENLINDKFPHLYRLVLNPDNTFQISIDNKEVNSGSLLEDFTPSVNPPAEIEDPTDKKPADWDEREQIPDPTATKPDDWDEDAPSQIVDESATKPEGWLDNEPEHIPDPIAKKPADWDSEMDGEWEPPLIDNPACTNAPGCGAWEPPMIDNPNFKGKWRAPMIDNPNYKGKWRPRLIPNPEFFEDKKPFAMTAVVAVGFELWSMSKDMLFDNLILTEDINIAEEWAAATFEKKRQKIAKDSTTIWGKILRATNYKPGLWGIYIVYCTIPVIVYIGYLYYYKCDEESVVDKLANLTVEYPILWGVYILVLGIPVVLILYCCCKSSSTAKKETRTEADKKKTDEPSEDIEEEPNQEQIEEEEEEDKAESRSESEDNEIQNKEKKVPGETARKRKVRKE